MSDKPRQMESLRTARFRLEPLLATHAESLFVALSAPEIYRYIPSEPPRDVATLAARYRWLETRRSSDGKESWLNWAVFFPAQNSFTGFVQATIYPNGEASLAYVLHPAYWGIGCATEACAAVTEHLFAQWPVSQINATVDTRNERSIRLLERLGFTRVATRDSEDLIGGEASREHVYALTRKAP